MVNNFYIVIWCLCVFLLLTLQWCFFNVDHSKPELHFKHGPVQTGPGPSINCDYHGKSLRKAKICCSLRVPFLSTIIVFIYDFYSLIICTILKRCHLDSSMSFNLKCKFSVDILSYPALQSYKVGLSNEKYSDFFYFKKMLATFSIFIITSGLKQYLFTKIWKKKSFKISPFLLD